jgi:hypothetical protein
MFGEGGASTVVRAALKFGVAHMLSSGVRLSRLSPPQLPTRDGWLNSMCAVTTGLCTTFSDASGAAFHLILDTAVSSRRERDIAKRYRMGGLGRWSGQVLQAALAHS